VREKEHYFFGFVVMVVPIKQEDNHNNELPSLFDKTSFTQEAGEILMSALTAGYSAAADNLANNHKEWLTFQSGDLDELLCSCPPTYSKQMKHHKTTRSDRPTTYQYQWCRCGCGYRLTLRISVVSGIEEVCYKELDVCHIVAACFQ
jgi:hypothetical protein